MRTTCKFYKSSGKAMIRAAGSVALLLSPVYGLSGELSKGFTIDDNEALFKTIYDRYQHLPGHLISVGKDGDYYSLSSDGGGIGHYTLSNDTQAPKGWPLTRWEYEYLEKEVAGTYYNGFHLSVYDHDQYVADELKLTHLMGCMQAAPLRYGDVDGDGQSELVLFLADQVSTDFVMFSPTRQKVIFSSKLNFTDAIRADDVPDHYLHESNYQYLGWRDVRAGEPPTPAIRAYGKLYFGDFNADEKRDILVWRKVYETHLQNEEVPGFKKTGETLLHYSLVNGEYLPQNTAPADIESWLAANELTWSDGYPRLSECLDEEGQLIPEMHDPLLNDPDVLPTTP